jgi:hypothetical protein
VITTFLPKSIFESEPSAALEQLRAVPVPAFRDLWKSLVAPVASLFNFDFVVANFYGLIDALFALVITPQPTPASAGVAVPRIMRSSGGGFSRSTGTGLRNYFSSDVRNTIIEAGRSRMMVRLAYDGYDRAVEPYKLEYYVRKKDGRALEYFWGWDTTGGKSGKVGIKQFICDKIQSVQPTSLPFQPRYAVEF